MTQFRIVDVTLKANNTAYVVSAQALDANGFLFTAEVSKSAIRSPKSKESLKAIQEALQARYDEVEGKGAKRESIVNKKDLIGTTVG